MNHQFCVEECPKVFASSEDGWEVLVRKGDSQSYEEEREAIRRAELACPVDAVVVAASARRQW